MVTKEGGGETSWDFLSVLQRKEKRGKGGGVMGKERGNRGRRTSALLVLPGPATDGWGRARKGRKKGGKGGLREEKKKGKKRRGLILETVGR